MYLSAISLSNGQTIKRHVLSTLVIDSDQQTRLMKSTSWADGLRGLATLGVVASHLTLCFARSIEVPCCSQDGKTPKLFQLPVLRLISAGHSWVAVFFVLMGFVNALKPLKLARANQHEESVANLANNALRRVFRLILPATLATLVAWLACQLNLMERGRHSDAWWLYTNTPAPSSNLASALGDLVLAFGHTWLHNTGINLYDQPQWTMLFLLEGSLMILLALLVTLKLVPRWRAIVLAVVAISGITWTSLPGDPPVGFTVFAGILLAELSLTNHASVLVNHKLTPFFATVSILLGLFLMSHTGDLPENAPWSFHLENFGLTYFPNGAQGQIFRTWGSFGAVLLILGIVLSPTARSILSIKPLTWFGRVSFPIFLLHPLFMQTIMPLFAFAFSTQTYPSDPPLYDYHGNRLMIERYPQRGNIMLWFSMIIAMGACFIASEYWIVYIEPQFGRITKWAEEHMTGTVEHGSGNSVLPQNTMQPSKNGNSGEGQPDHARNESQYSVAGVLTPPLDRGMSPSRSGTVLTIPDEKTGRID